MTMHRVQNVGSVLQAYALQRKIEQLGYEAELIDYEFPPLKDNTRFTVRDVFGYGWSAIQGFPNKKKQQKLDAFRKEYLCCSKQSYTRERLLADPPLYDVYCTGSDQVWNPIHVGLDTSFMMDFAPAGTPRIAYASSFATQDVGEPYYSLYAKHLRRYKHITVREQSGASIIKQMTGKDASVTCDPTLLLSADEWRPIVDASDVNLPQGYILVYLLRYMFDPRPGFYNIVESVRKALQLPVYQYNPYSTDSFIFKIKALNGLGPADFVSIVKNASFLITDSFHGAAFATIFNVPMIGVVKDDLNGDGRIATLRAKVGGENSVVCHNKSLKMCPDVSLYRGDSKMISNLRSSSLEELKKMLVNKD